MAHVGVLKVLEEVGLQPDYITGTSLFIDGGMTLFPGFREGG